MALDYRDLSGEHTGLNKILDAGTEHMAGERTKNATKHKSKKAAAAHTAANPQISLASAEQKMQGRDDARAERHKGLLRSFGGSSSTFGKPKAVALDIGNTTGGGAVVPDPVVAPKKAVAPVQNPVQAPAQTVAPTPEATVDNTDPAPAPGAAQNPASAPANTGEGQPGQQEKKPPQQTPERKRDNSALAGMLGSMGGSGSGGGGGGGDLPVAPSYSQVKSKSQKKAVATANEHLYAKPNYTKIKGIGKGLQSVFRRDTEVATSKRNQKVAAGVVGQGLRNDGSLASVTAQGANQAAVQSSRNQGASDVQGLRNQGSLANVTQSGKNQTAVQGMRNKGAIEDRNIRNKGRKTEAEIQGLASIDAQKVKSKADKDKAMNKQHFIPIQYDKKGNVREGTGTYTSPGTMSPDFNAENPSAEDIAFLNRYQQVYGKEGIQKLRDQYTK